MTDKDISEIPSGMYCYSGTPCGDDPNYELCPYWSAREDKPEQENGYCSFLERGDWSVEGLSLLWDQVKECRVKPGIEEIIFFLDFDGVINSDESYDKSERNNLTFIQGMSGVCCGISNWGETKKFVQENCICPELVGNMRSLFDKYPDAHFVVSSNWGRRWSLEKIKEILEPFLPVERLDITPKKLSSSKIHEIPFWLFDHFGDSRKWREKLEKENHKVIIIDDVNYGFDFGSFFKIDGRVGLTKKNLEEIDKYITARD